MQKLTIAIGADHRGFAMKEFLKQEVTISDYSLSWLDVGAFDAERSDYPIFAIAVSKAIKEHKADVGVLICGTGVGIAVAANRFPGIYAGVAWNNTVAQLSKQDDNINVLVLPSDFVTNEQALQMVTMWLQASFKEGRYAQRIALIDAIIP